MSTLANQIALVTGGNRGIGRAISVAFAKAGADVVVNYRNRAKEAAGAAEEIRSLGRRCAVIQADVSQAREVDRLVTDAEKELGDITILVNNAAIARVQPIEEITEGDWDDLIDINLKSCFLVTQRVLPGMRARKYGRIINLSSVAATTGGIVGPHYAASKAGMLGLTRFYASKFAKEGITANAIAPALIDTDMVRSNPNASPDRIPVGRFGTVEEVAELAVTIAGNGYLTGQTIHLNGGWYVT